MKTILAVILAMHISTITCAVEGAGTLATPAASGNQDQLIDQMLIVSGLNRTLRHLPVQIESDLLQMSLRSGANEGEQQKLEKLLKQALPRGAFVGNVSSALRKHYDEQRYTHFVQLLSGPVAKRMVALEAREPNPADAEAFLAQVSKHPLSSERLMLIHRIDVASGAGELLTKMTIASIEAGALAAGDDCPEAVANIRKMIAKMLPDIGKANHSSVKMMLAFTYREVSDIDLDIYANLYEDGDSKWAMGIAAAAIEEQFKSSLEQGTRVIKKVVLAHRPKKTMFAPKCGQSESPNKVEPVKERSDVTEVISHADAAESKVATPAIKANAAEGKVAVLERNSAPRRKAVRKDGRKAGSGKDIRACLNLATSAEIIACSEK